MELHNSRQKLVVALALVLLLAAWEKIACAAIDPISIDLGFGTIKAMVGDTPDALTGSFTVTKKGADNKTLTLAQLEKMLGQDHLNWFQKVTDQQPAADVPKGVNIPFIDPPNGGLPIDVDPTWADDRPWYWDEFTPNPVPKGRTVEAGLQLSANSAGSKLDYFDAPGGQKKGTTISFSTFLVSDFGNKTYDILGQGYSWQTMFPDNTGTGKISNITDKIDFKKEFQDEIKNDFGWLRAKGPDTSKSTDTSPTWVAREKGPAGAVINVQPTNGGKRIENADGSIVQYSKSVPTGNDDVNFSIPGIINGKKVTDATQRTGKGRDPGTLSFSIFDDNKMMIQDSLSSWLMNNSYNSEDTGLFMPDFFPDPSSGVDEVFYGADMDELTGAGKSFVDNTAFDQTFSVGSLSSMLPGYVFSSTPLDYVPGQGWVGTPLDAGMQLSYVAYHDVYAVPEPSMLILTSLALIGAYVVCRRENRVCVGRAATAN